MTPAEFAALHDECLNDPTWTVKHCATMDDVWRTIHPTWLVWIATRPGVLDDRTLRRFAVWSARQVQHLMTDQRSIAALDVAERHTDGQATDDELATAFDSAASAARSTAGDSVIDAAGDAAQGAAMPLSLSAALSASWSSAEAAARAAAQDSEYTAWATARAAQAAWLRANATRDWVRMKRQIGGAK